jgi:L-aminopeptidase/D-esterase-like protein
MGAFLQANFGRREHLVIAGVPVGRLLADWTPAERPAAETGSIIAILATDAPLLPHQLARCARRAALGVGRSGAISGHGSGDIFLALSTANIAAIQTPAEAIAKAEFIPEEALNPLFAAVIESVDEAVLNAMVANEDMVGAQGRLVPALPHDEVRRLMEERA